MDVIIIVFAIIGFLAALTLVIRLLTEAITALMNTTANCICKIKKTYLKAQRRLEQINNPGKKKKGKRGKKATNMKG